MAPKPPRKAADGDKKRQGFRVGPDNLPDGPWRRKGTKQTSFFIAGSHKLRAKRLTSHRIQRSNKTALGSLRSVTLGCDRGGAYKSSHRVTEADRRRRYTRPTRRVSCPFRFQIKPGDNGAWKAFMVSDMHNHPLSKDDAEHAKQRQLFLSPAIKNEIIAMFNAKVPARKVLAELEKKYGDLPIRRKDLYNLKRTASIKSQLRGSSSQSPEES